VIFMSRTEEPKPDVKKSDGAEAKGPSAQKMFGGRAISEKILGPVAGLALVAASAACGSVAVDDEVDTPTDADAEDVQPEDVDVPETRDEAETDVVDVPDEATEEDEATDSESDVEADVEEADGDAPTVCEGPHEEVSTGVYLNEGAWGDPISGYQQRYSLNGDGTFTMELACAGSTEVLASNTSAAIDTDWVVTRASDSPTGTEVTMRPLFEGSGQMLCQISVRTL